MRVGNSMSRCIIRKAIKIDRTDGSLLGSMAIFGWHALKFGSYNGLSLK